MSRPDAFYEVFWALPTAPLPVAGEIEPLDGESLPDPVVNKRTELQRTLVLLDLTDAEQIQDAIGCCDLYARSLRAARTVDELVGQTTWKSALTFETTTVPLVFDEPMVHVLQATLLFNLGTNHAHKKTAECISEAAQCFCQAAGLIEYVIAVEEETCLSLQADVPAELPELSPRILRAFVDGAVAMAQQLAIIKATLFPVDKPYIASVLQKLHAGCQNGFESFESAVVRSCYSARPKRHGCATLLGYATIFSRLHHAMVLELAGELAFTNAAYGKAIAFTNAALRQLQERQSMRDLGLPPLEADGGLYHQHQHLMPRLEAKRLSLESLVAQRTKDNDAIYFETIPAEETVLMVEFARVLVMKPVQHNTNTRLGSVRMFREVVDPSNEGDIVTKLDGADSEDEDDNGDENDDDVGDDQESCEVVIDQESQMISPPVRDAPSKEDEQQAREGREADLEAGSFTVCPVEEDLMIPDASSSPKKHAKSLADARPIVLPTSTQAPLVSAQSRRRMATRVQPQKAMTIRNLIPHDSLIILQQSEEELRKVVTDDALAQMRRSLLGGIEMYRLVKERWKKEILRVYDDQVVFVRKKPIAILSKQQKFPWATVHAFQHELQPTNHILQLLAPPGKRMTSILLIARRGDMVQPTEITFRTPEENAIAVACLQQFLLEKRST